MNYQQKYRCCGIDAFNDENWRLNEKQSPDCFYWKDRYPFGCGCDPSKVRQELNPKNDIVDWENPCWQMDRNQLESKFKCRQDMNYNTDVNSGNYKGLYLNGCRNQINSEFDEFLNVFSISGIVIGVLFVVVGLFSVCVCLCPGKNLDSE